MKKINFQNDVTKVNAETFNTFQNNIEEASVPTGGTIGQVLTKSSNEDNKVNWTDPIETQVINNLNSSSTTSALSANQGRELNNKIALVKEEIVNNHTYSTEEQRIGTWMGKPLYRKTIIFTDSVSPANKIQKSHNISNVDTIFIDTSHSFITSETDGTFPLPSIGYFGKFNDRIEVNVDKTYIYIYSETTWDTIWTKVVTLLYTKTTD